MLRYSVTSYTIKTARRMIGLKSDGTNTDVEMNTMSELSCVPALILLNGALRHYGLKMIYFHPKKKSDELLSLNQRAYMSRTIRTNISDARKDELEIKFAKEGRVRIGYTRLQVLNTTHEPGREVANQYIKWYNDHKFDIMPELEGVCKSEVTDTSKVPDIGLKYKHLCPKTTLPLDEASEPEVEDECPMSNTTGMGSDSEESSSEEESSEKKSPPDKEKSTPTAKDSNAHLSDGSEESEEKGAKLPSRREEPEDDPAAGPKRPPRSLIGEMTASMTDTMKEVQGTIFGKSTSTRASKKRKDVGSVKPAPKPKKLSTRSKSHTRDSIEDASADAAKASNEDSEVNAVTPARPA